MVEGCRTRRLLTGAYGTKPVVGSVDLALVGDGFDLATVHVDIEIAPL
jgi:hypothetical protein